MNGHKEYLPKALRGGKRADSALKILAGWLLLGRVGMEKARKRMANWLDPGRDKSTQSPPLKPALPPGYQPIAEHAPEDVFVVGYPKSGNTWVQCMLAAAIYGIDIELAPVSIVRELVPDVHDQPIYRRHASPMYFKSHALPDPSYRRVVYLLRDGRDVMVSYLHYLEAILNRKLDITQLIKTGAELFPCKWAEHVRTWLANPLGCEMIVVRYEDLKRDALGELRRMCRFAGVERNEAILKSAILKTSFEVLRKRETQWDRSKRWPKDRHFFRRGEVGAYADEMPPEARTVFWEQAGDLLIELGYATGSECENKARPG